MPMASGMFGSAVCCFFWTRLPWEVVGGLWVLLEEALCRRDSGRRAVGEGVGLGIQGVASVWVEAYEERTVD